MRSVFVLPIAGVEVAGARRPPCLAGLKACATTTILAITVVAASTTGVSGQSSAQPSTATGEWPAYALAADFKARADCPPGYRYCVAINLENQAAFSIVCEEVSALTIDSDEELKPLQTCMRTEDNPIASVMLKDGKLMLVSDVATMQHFLTPRAAA